MDSNTQILSQEEVLSVAKEKWTKDFAVVNYKIDSFSKERLGFLSLHKKLIIQIEEKQSKQLQSHTFFVKCLPPNDDPLSMCMTDMGVFNREIAFYKYIVPALHVNFKEEVWSPICFGNTKNALVLEDLRNQKFSLAPSKTFSYVEMKSLLSAIARMHAASIVAEKRLGKALNEAYPQAFDLYQMLKPDGFFRKWYQAGVNLGIHLAKEIGLSHNKIQSNCDRLFDLIIPKTGIQNVITHSDLWSNNILFNDESPPLCKLIDFQWTRYCPPAQDVILVLHYCNDKAFRAKYMEEMLHYYYEEIKRILGNHNLKAFSWEELAESIKEQMIVAKIMMVLCFPSIFMDGDFCAQMMSDPKKYMEFMFSDKAPMTMSLYYKGGEYEERVKQAVIELVEFCENTN